MGTPSYMAPEQARGEVDRLDERCDVFALGSILCEVLTGEPAFVGRSSGEIQRKASRGELQDALDRLQGCGNDAELIALAKDCLAAELEDRPRHAGDVSTRINAYQTGVQERLRRAEIARAEEKARAKEAIKRARVERNLLRLTIALAASLIGLVVLGGGGAIWFFQQRDARLANVEATLARIEAIRDQAEADDADPARWSQALAAADQALASIGDLAASRPGRRLIDLRAKIASDQKQAERDRTLIEELTSCRMSLGKTSWENDPPKLDRRFNKAFKRYGLDLEATPRDDAVERLKSRAPAVVREVVGSLDHWLFVCQEIEGSSVKGQRLIELAKRLDPEPQRNSLRALFQHSDLKPQRKMLTAMSVQAKAIEFGPSSALLLSRLLNMAGDGSGAVAILRAAVIRYPDDPWTNFELARLLMKAQPPQDDESIRFYTALRALRPESGFDMVEILERLGRNEEVEMLLRDIVRRSPKRFLFLSHFFHALSKSGATDEARSVAERMTAPFLDALIQGAGNAQDLRALLRVIGDPTVSINTLHRAIRILPNEPELHFELARALGQVGDQEGEIAELREAIRTESLPRQEVKHSIDVHAVVPALSQTNVQGGQAVGATNEMEPDDGVLEAELDNAYFQGLSQGSGLRFPEDIDRGHLALGTALAEFGDIVEAIKSYEEAIRRDEISNLDSKTVLYGSLGAARRLRGDLPGAITAYREAIRLAKIQPEKAIEFRYGLALVLAESGDIPGAVFELRAAIRLLRADRVTPDALLPPMPPTPIPSRLDRVISDRLLKAIIVRKCRETRSKRFAVLPKR